mmetsp:Transcript_111567/g.302804  ORF Transcript_111567/g.302804 Transcript_111567/m.302804 type:complete len:129 (+) Transcript_111567:3137-3523(+)
MERRVDAEWKRFFEQRDLAEKEVRKALEKSQVEKDVDSGRRLPRKRKRAGAHLAVQSAVSKNSTVALGTNGTEDAAASAPAPRHHAATGGPAGAALAARSAESAAVRRSPAGRAAWTLLALLASASRW